MKDQLSEKELKEYENKFGGEDYSTEISWIRKHKEVLVVLFFVAVALIKYWHHQHSKNEMEKTISNIERITNGINKSAGPGKQDNNKKPKTDKQ